MNLLLDRSHYNLKPLDRMFVIDIVGFWNIMFRWELRPHVITLLRQVCNL